MNVETALKRKGREAATVAPDAILIDVAALLAAGRQEIVVVCDAGRTLLGVITDTDILRHVAACGRQQCGCAASVADAMTREVVTCRLDDDLEQVWRTMRDSGHRRMPVLDAEGRLAGVINVRDVFQLLHDEKEVEKHEILRFLSVPAGGAEPAPETSATAGG